MSLSHLCTRITTLEAQAWEAWCCRVAQMTEADRDAEWNRLAAHSGPDIQDYERFAETLSPSELEALCTADLPTMRRFARAFHQWRTSRP